MTEPKYSAASTGPRIDAFLRATLQNGGFELKYEIADAGPPQDDFETPDMVVKFTGRDVDLLLANRAELLLALEHVTMEMLRMPSEDHSRISFDANDYRLLRIEELRMSAVTAAEKVKRTGVPFQLQPHEQPRAPRDSHGFAQRDRSAQRELGSGPQRQVIVYPAGMASLPEPPRRILPAPPSRDGGRGGPPRRGDGPPRRGDGPPRRGDGRRADPATSRR